CERQRQRRTAPLKVSPARSLRQSLSGKVSPARSLRQRNPPPWMTVHHQATNERSSFYLVIKVRESDDIPRGIAPRVADPVAIVPTLGCFSDRTGCWAWHRFRFYVQGNRQETSHRVW